MCLQQTLITAMVQDKCLQQTLITAMMQNKWVYSRHWWLPWHKINGSTPRHRWWPWCKINVSTADT